MKASCPTHPSLLGRQTTGFVLPAMLVLIAGTMLLAIGALSLSGIERKTARSYTDSKRAEWVAKAGMEHFRQVLKEGTANDSYLIVSKPMGVQNNGVNQTADYLFLAQGKKAGSSISYDVQPLFSAGDSTKKTITDLKNLPDPATLRGDSAGNFPYPAIGEPGWIYLEDSNGKKVGRYAYWVEDLQGKVDAQLALNEQSLAGTNDAARAPYPHPAPGVSNNHFPAANWDTLQEETQTPSTDEDQLAKKIADNKNLILSPNSLLAAAEIAPPLERTQAGSLSNPTAAGIEESTTAKTRSYVERPTIPFAKGIAPKMVGEPKVNLNRLLSETHDKGVAEFAETIQDALPQFEERKGGFPEDYLKTLGASALDYADENLAPRIKTGEYRGIGSYPIVSEHLISLYWIKTEVNDDGRKILYLETAVYAELWNMTNTTISGDFQMTYETGFKFEVDAIPEFNLGDPDILNDLNVAQTNLSFSDGYYWFPKQSITLQGNEQRIVKCGSVLYLIDIGDSSTKTPPFIYPEEPFSGDYGYHLRWNGTIVDFAAGGLKHNSVKLNDSNNTKSNPRHKVRSTVPGHSYAGNFSGFANNMGDPRMAYYLQLLQDANSYPDNYSPNRRTIRYGTIYNSDAATKPKIYGRVMPSEWPDGGHNSLFGPRPTEIKNNGDERIPPDDPSFFSNLPTPEPEKAPTRLSKRGYFLSESELGHIYDPIMWQSTYPNSADTSRIRSGFMPDGQTSWPLVESNSPPNAEYGGGNTLRIGRPEHPRFQQAGLAAAYLLDLFHAGYGNSSDKEKREGNLAPMNYRVNVNTAPRDALRMLAAGILKQDPQLAERTSEIHQMEPLMAPPTKNLILDAPQQERLADVIADAIILNRPFAAAGELAAARDSDSRWVFGNPEFYQEGDKIEWTDAAAEEIFARVYNATTLRSRNFRVWVIGQAIVPQDNSENPQILAEVRKTYTIFADPAERSEEGEIDKTKYQVSVSHESNF